MTYHQPIGYLGATASDLARSEYSTMTDAQMRQQAISSAAALWSAYSRLMPQARPLMDNVSWSTPAFVEGARLLRRMSDSRVSMPMPIAAYGALIKASMARLSSMAIKLKRLSGATDIRYMFPSIVDLHESGMSLAASIEQMGSQARGRQSGASGLGIWPLIWTAAYIIVAWEVAKSFFDSSSEAEEVMRMTDDRCSRWEREHPGLVCTPELRDQFHEQALEALRETGIRGTINDIVKGSGLPSVADAAESLLDKLGTAGIVAISVGGAALLGIGVYAAWPYIAAGRGVGKRLQKVAER